MKIYPRALLTLLLTSLTACSSTAPAPDWQSNADSFLQSFTAAYLNGNTQLADLEFARARNEIAGTGRADLVGRAELIRCATRVASLEFDDCPGFQALAQDVGSGERAYADYLAGRWQGLDTAMLPAAHRATVAAAAGNGGKSLLDAIPDPLSRLVAAGALLQSGRMTPPDIVAATETASNQGWRRPLLAWLGVQARRAHEAGDRDAAVRIQRRIDLASKPVGDR
jgi:hypothetical protein